MYLEGAVSRRLCLLIGKVLSLVGPLTIVLVRSSRALGQFIKRGRPLFFLGYFAALVTGKRAIWKLKRRT